MTPLLENFLAWIDIHGEWVLFLLTMAETCFVTGAVVESGMATALATILAGGGHLSYERVALAALAGGWVGDSVGFWIGRRGGEWLAQGKGRLARRYRKKRDEGDRIFGRHPLISVTCARLVPFVRSVMPLAAGMSRIITYRRYLAYESIGLVGWVIIYMGVGWLAGESLETATRMLGIGGALAVLLAALVGWRMIRRRTGSREGAEWSRSG